MDKFKKQFIMDMFLDTDSTATINRSVLCLANTIKENSDNLSAIIQIVNANWKDVQKASNNSVICEIPTRRIKDYYENAVRNFNDEEYFAIFKVKKSTVQALINFVKPFIPSGSIALDKKVHVFLMFLMSDLSFNDIGRLFGLHKSSASHIFQELGSVLVENRFDFITWPSLEDQHITRIKVNNRFKFPNCVGFIDVCRFKVGSKTGKSKHNTILLQAVCDERLMFIDIHIGELGQTKKHKVFRDSILAGELQNFVDSENHILGDSEYKLHLNLITPFKSEELLTSEEMKFNEIHWKARSYVGRAFELLKEKFRKLNHIDSFAASVNILIYSACVLHNFILLHEGSSDVKDEDVSCSVTLNSDIEMSPVEKRQFLCNYINYIDTNPDPMLLS